MEKRFHFFFKEVYKDHSLNHLMLLGLDPQTLNFDFV